MYRFIRQAESLAKLVNPLIMENVMISQVYRLLVVNARKPFTQLCFGSLIDNITIFRDQVIRGMEIYIFCLLCIFWIIVTLPFMSYFYFAYYFLHKPLYRIRARDLKMKRHFYVWACSIVSRFCALFVAYLRGDFTIILVYTFICLYLVYDVYFFYLLLRWTHVATFRLISDDFRWRRVPELVHLHYGSTFVCHSQIDCVHNEGNTPMRKNYPWRTVGRPARISNLECFETHAAPTPPTSTPSIVPRTRAIYANHMCREEQEAYSHLIPPSNRWANFEMWTFQYDYEAIQDELNINFDTVVFQLPQSSLLFCIRVDYEQDHGANCERCVNPQCEIWNGRHTDFSIQVYGVDDYALFELGLAHFVNCLHDGRLFLSHAIGVYQSTRNWVEQTFAPHCDENSMFQTKGKKRRSEIRDMPAPVNVKTKVIRKYTGGVTHQVARLTGRVFDSNEYVPSYLIDLTFDDVESLLASIISNNKTVESKTPEQIDLERRVSELRCVYLTPAGLSLLKSFLIKEIVLKDEKLVAESSAQIAHVNQFFDETALRFIAMSDFSNDLFVAPVANKKRGKTVRAKLTIQAEGDLHILLDNVVSSKMLPLDKVRQIVSDMKKRQIGIDRIREVLLNKMPVWNVSKVPGQELKNYCWILSYVPHKYFKYSAETIDAFWRLIRDKFLDVRSQIINYAVEHFNYAGLSDVERARNRDLKKKRFIRYMRKPEYQMQFIRGVPKEVIVEEIHRKHFTRLLDNPDVLIQTRKRVKVDKSKEIQSSRAKKYAFVDFEPHSKEETKASVDGWLLTFLSCLPYHVIYMVYSCICSWFTLSWQASKVYAQDKVIAPIVSKATSIVIQKINPFQHWIDIFRNMKIGQLTQEEIIMLVDVKAWCHTAYYCYRGDRMAAMSHATYSLVTRGNELFSHISTFIEKFKVSELSKDDNIEFIEVRGRDDHLYKLTVQEFEQYRTCCRNKQEYEFSTESKFRSGVVEEEAQFYESSPRDREVIKDDDFQPHTKEMLASISALLQIINPYDEEPDDMRKKAYHISYVRGMAGQIYNYSVFMHQLMSLAGRLIFGVDPFDVNLTAFVKTILDAIENMNTILLMSPEEFAAEGVIHRVLKQSEDNKVILRDPLFGKILTVYSQNFLAVSNRFAPKILDAKNQFSLTQQRITPFVVLIGGPNGTGKSRGNEWLMNHIGAWMVKNGHPGDIVLDPLSVYYYSRAQEYFDGYTPNSTHVVMDDFLQPTLGTSRQAEALTFSGMADNVPFPLNMAELSAKGKVYFKAQYMWLTSNAFNQQPNNPLNCGLADEGAVHRRIQLRLYRRHKSEANVMDNKYLVVTCAFMPEVEGQELTLQEVLEVVGQCRLRQVEREIRGRLSEAQIRANVGLPEFQPQDSLTETLGVIVRTFNLGLYKWAQSPYVKWFILIACIICTVATVLPLAKFLFGDELNFFEQSKGNFSGEKEGKAGKPKKLRKRWRDHTRPTIESDFGHNKDAKFDTHSLETNYYKSLVNTIFHSVGKVGFAAYSDDTLSQELSARSQTVFHVRDGIYVTAAHFFLHAFQYDHLRFKIAFGHRCVEFPLPDDIVKVVDTDMVAFRLPVHFDNPPELYKYLMGEDNAIDIVEGYSLQLITNGALFEPKIIQLTKADRNDSVSYQVLGEPFIVECPITYYQNTDFGFSGAPIFAMGPQGRASLIGMHVGAATKNKTYGVAIPMCKESLDAVLDSFQPVLVTHSGYDGFPLEICGHLPIGQYATMSTRNSIRRTKMYGFAGPPIYVPVHMRPFENEAGDTINPYYLGLKKYHQTYTPRSDIPDSVMDYLFYHYPRVTSRLYTFEEALSGIPGEISSIDVSTSPGHPYRIRATKGKAPYIITNPDNTYTFDKEFRESLDYYDGELREGRQIEVLWADALKVERREIEKVNAGKTRLFCICPLHYLFLIRKYFLGIVTYIQSRSVDHPVSVGINVTSVAWTRLYNRMNSTAGSVLSGDFSNYDGMLPRFVGEVVLNFINSWYDDGEVNARVRALLFEHIYNPTRVSGDVMYKVFDGNPSGNPITSIYNSLCNMVMNYTIMLLDFGLPISDYNLAVYGDDHFLTTKTVGLSCSDLSPHFKRRFNMTYTRFEKNSDTTIIDDMTTVSYLGRKFVKCDSIFLAPLEMRVIVESLYWKRTGAMDNLAVLATAESFFSEIFHHGKYEHQKWSDAFIAAVNERMPQLLTAVSRINYPWIYYYQRNYCCDSENETGSFSIDVERLKSLISF
jgi:hypothetical protein